MYACIHCVKVVANAADIRRSCSEDQWRILPWCASHSTATGYCLSCRRSQETSSSCSKTVLQCTAHATQSNVLNGRHPRSLHQTCGPPIVQILTQSTKRYGAKCSNGSTNKSSWPGWTEAASYQCVAWLVTKHHRWRNWWVTQTSACVYSCQKRTFWAFTLTQRHEYDNFSVLSLWILKENYCYCVKHVRFFFYFWSFVFRKIV